MNQLLPAPINLPPSATVVFAVLYNQSIFTSLILLFSFFFKLQFCPINCASFSKFINDTTS
ncbi:MAG: hypothetical protein QXU98_08630 [Candidatus Parvarchaeota archaeon]